MKSNATFQRIISAVILLPIYLLLVWSSGFGFLPCFPILIVSTVVSLACLYEYFQIIAGTDQGKPFLGVGLIAGLLVNVLVYFFTFGKVMALSSYFAEYDARWFFALIMVVLIAMMITQVFIRPIKGGIFSLAATLFGVIYIVLFFSHIIMIRSLTNGFIYLLILHVIVMINDTFAYFGGVCFGRHKTGLMVSPNKSWEGYFSGILFSMISVIVVNEFFNIFYGLHLFGTIEAAFVGIFFSIAGDLGDLVESAVKRDGKVKDSGRLIPGHGGMWDVFDALIFSLPLFYYYLKIKGVQ